ncbi:unnamed protein product [Rhizophagus irregularis]|nr:unnamed protein product [Rhizophagus irregularis]
MPPVGKGKGKEVKKTSKRKSLSFVQKKELCEWKRDNPSYNQNDLAKKYDISNRKNRGAKFPEIESALYLWMQQALASNLTITGDILKAKALNFVTQLQTTTFTASDGWLSKFKKCYNIKQFIKAGEANSAPFRNIRRRSVALQEIIEQYDLVDVYNVDANSFILEFRTIQDTFGSLYFLALKNQKSGLQCFNLELKRMIYPFGIIGTVTAWMQVSVWRDYLNKLNQLMKTTKIATILLLADNAPDTFN